MSKPGYTGNGHPQNHLTRLAAQRNFAKMRIEGAKTVKNIFNVYNGEFRATLRAEILSEQLVSILDQLEEELDVIWLKRKEEIKNGK